MIFKETMNPNISNPQSGTKSQTCCGCGLEEFDEALAPVGF